MVVVTGVSGNLGKRLLRQLQDFSVIGVDAEAPSDGFEGKFEHLDLGLEPSCHELVELFRRNDVRAVVHLAFLTEPHVHGSDALDRMWQANVAGTARVMEAITEVNRNGGLIDTFIFPGSAMAYGPETRGLVSEDHPLEAGTLTYALHQKEADDVARFRAPSMGKCTTYILRTSPYAGSAADNWLMGALRGTPSERGALGRRRIKKAQRVSLILPSGEKYLQKRLQFVHIDDVARLITHLLRQAKRKNETVVLNVSGRGEAVTIKQAADIAQQKVVHVPTRLMAALAMRTRWNVGTSIVPPDALPYLYGSCVLDTSRLRQFLGKDYERVIRYTVEHALQDSFHAPQPAAVPETAQSVP